MTPPTEEPRPVDKLPIRVGSMEPEIRSKDEKSSESLPSTDEESVYMEGAGVEMDELNTLIAANQAPYVAVPGAPVPKESVPVKEKIETKKKKKSFRFFGKKGRKSFPRNKGAKAKSPSNNSIPSLILTNSQDGDVSLLESVGPEERSPNRSSKMNGTSPTKSKATVGPSETRTLGSPREEPKAAEGAKTVPGQEKKTIPFLETSTSEQITERLQKAVSLQLRQEGSSSKDNETVEYKDTPEMNDASPKASKDLTFKGKARRQSLNLFSKKKNNVTKEQVAVVTPQASSSVERKSLNTVQSVIQDKSPVVLLEKPKLVDEDASVVDAAADISRKWALFFHEERGEIDNISLDSSQESVNDSCVEATPPSTPPLSGISPSFAEQGNSKEETPADCATEEEKIPADNNGAQDKLLETFPDNKKRSARSAVSSDNDTVQGTASIQDTCAVETEAGKSGLVPDTHLDSETKSDTERNDEIGDDQDKYAVNGRTSVPSNADWDTDVLANEGQLIATDRAETDTSDERDAIHQVIEDVQEEGPDTFVPSFGVCGICIDVSGSVEVTAPLKSKAPPMAETEAKTFEGGSPFNENTPAVASGNTNTHSTPMNSTEKLSANDGVVALADNISVNDGAGSFDASEHETESNINKPKKYDKSNSKSVSRRFKMIDEKSVDEAELEKQANEFCEQLDDMTISNDSITKDAVEEFSAITLPDSAYFPETERARTPLSVEFDENEFESMMENHPCGTAVPLACRNVRVQKKTESHFSSIVDACDILAACGRPIDATQDISVRAESEMGLAVKDYTTDGETIYGEEDSVDPFKILDFFDEASLDDSFWSALDERTLQTASVHSTPASNCKHVFKEESKPSISSNVLGSEKESVMELDDNDYDDSIFDTVADIAEEEDTNHSEAIQNVAPATNATQSTLLKSAIMTKDVVSSMENICSRTEDTKRNKVTKTRDVAIEDVQKAMATLKQYAARHGISEPELLWKIQEEHRKRKAWKVTMAEI